MLHMIPPMEGPAAEERRLGVHAPYNTPAEGRSQDRPDNRPPGGEDQQALPVDLTRTAGLTTADEERPRAEVGQTKSW